MGTTIGMPFSAILQPLFQFYNHFGQNRSPIQPHTGHP